MSTRILEDLQMLSFMVRNDIPLKAFGISDDLFYSYFNETIGVHRSHRFLCPFTLTPINDTLVQLKVAPQFRQLRFKLSEVLNTPEEYIKYGSTILFKLKTAPIFYIFAILADDTIVKKRFEWDVKYPDGLYQPIKNPLHENILSKLMGF